MPNASVPKRRFPLLGSIHDPYTRFITLSIESQAWVETNLNSAGPILVTDENMSQVRRIAEQLPIRVRWRKLDRFGKYYQRSTRQGATHFVLECRLDETQIRKVRSELEKQGVFSWNHKHPANQNLNQKLEIKF
jgi:hypothetical protein